MKIDTHQVDITSAKIQPALGENSISVRATDTEAKGITYLKHQTLWLPFFVCIDRVYCISTMNLCRLKYSKGTRGIAFLTLWSASLEHGSAKRWKQRQHTLKKELAIRRRWRRQQRKWFTVLWWWKRASLRKWGSTRPRLHYLSALRCLKPPHLIKPTVLLLLVKGIQLVCR